VRVFIGLSHRPRATITRVRFALPSPPTPSLPGLCFPRASLPPSCPLNGRLLCCVSRPAPALTKTPDRSDSDHQAAVCVFDDLIEFGGPGGAQVIPQMLPVFIAFATADDPHLRQVGTPPAAPTPSALRMP